MITIRNVSKWYGSFRVLKNCSTEVEKGEVVLWPHGRIGVRRAH